MEDKITAAIKGAIENAPARKFVEAVDISFTIKDIDLKNPNFADCGIAMGGKGIRIENPADLDAGIKEALAMDGPVVVDVVTDSNELTMPPEIMPARAWGFAISKIKELVVSSSV